MDYRVVQTHRSEFPHPITLPLGVLAPVPPMTSDG